MSNKNLKVYQIQFITEIKKLYFNVKFPCQIKAVWKRSNEVAETTLVPIQNGIVNFNQTLKLSVNMYFDTVTSKFVEKKCLYSFLISTQKGEKSAGTVSFDLAQFFNKRIYDIDQTFSLQKCPVAGTKVEMKITYEEDTKEKGYDSMSCISASNQLDSSTLSLDLGELTTKSDISQKHSQNQTEKSSKSDRDLSQSGFTLQKEEKFQKLQASDIADNSQDQRPSGTKIGENIKSLNSLTSKINEFVNSKSKNIRFQIEGLKRRISQLEQEAQNERLAKQRFEKLFQEEKKKNATLNREYLDYKTDAEHKLGDERRRSAEIEAKSRENQRLIAQLQARMSESGESQSAYIEQIKSNALAAEQKLSLECRELRQSLVQERKIRNEQNAKLQELEGQLSEWKGKYGSEVEKNNSLEDNMRRKEEQIEATRINLEKAYENLVKSLNSVL